MELKLKKAILNDVFGMRGGNFKEPEALNEISRKFLKGRRTALTAEGKRLIANRPVLMLSNQKALKLMEALPVWIKTIQLLPSINMAKGYLYRSLLDKEYKGNFSVPPYEPEFIEVK